MAALAGWPRICLGGVATALCAIRENTGKDFLAAAERDEDIPDEVYTLW